MWRVYLVYFVVLAFAIAIIGRASYIQFALKDELLKKAKEQEIKYFPMEAMRGNILARDGSLLAASIPDFEIRMTATWLGRSRINSMCFSRVMVSFGQSTTPACPQNLERIRDVRRSSSVISPCDSLKARRMRARSSFSNSLNFIIESR